MKLNRDKFRVQCAIRNVSGTKVAEYVGYSKGWLHAIKKDFINIRPETAKGMAKFLGCKVSDIFDEVEG